MNADTSQILIQALTGLFYAIPTLLFIGIGIHYLIKKGNTTDGIFIVIGNIIILLSIVIGKILFIQFVVYQKWDSTVYTYIISAINIVSFIGSILFVIGLFLLTKKVIKVNNS
ncbi:hypothetical protein AWE51_13455 [Aquimarina aggregata]|uniref:Uncharacterized protein n=1 Tax=Aquimarina aggregata TaxID=1642818 RepID=A0A162XFE5_9FLAO|nr:hypothetical protein [Aquimarina aggregata]KZS38601.1 hypothetical protein AWE51_13455 [Aquimarina aggregata]